MIIYKFLSCRSLANYCSYSEDKIKNLDSKDKIK